MGIYYRRMRFLVEFHWSVIHYGYCSPRVCSSSQGTANELGAENISTCWSLTPSLSSEQLLAARAPTSRPLVGADSQVTLAALLKGRSSSYRINYALARSLPTVLGAELFPSYGFVPSKVNVSDDPTRHARSGPLQSHCLDGGQKLKRDASKSLTHGCHVRATTRWSLQSSLGVYVQMSGRLERRLNMCPP